MAIYHCSVKMIGRSSGRSSVAAAAYRAGVKLKNESAEFYPNQKAVHDFSNRKGVVWSAIMLPSNAPMEYHDRETLWNAVEAAEKRVNSQTAREIEVALPVEFNREEQIEVLKNFVKRNLVMDGMAADVAIHDKQDGNPHAHIMLTTRLVDLTGFGDKERSWNSKEHLEYWRELWETACNFGLKKHGTRIDHRSLRAQGIDREPQWHLGVTVMQMVKKQGGKSIRLYQENERIKGMNAEVALLDRISADLEKAVKAENTAIIAQQAENRRKIALAALKKRNEQEAAAAPIGRAAQVNWSAIDDEDDRVPAPVDIPEPIRTPEVASVTQKEQVNARMAAISKEYIKRQRLIAEMSDQLKNIARQERATVSLRTRWKDAPLRHKKALKQQYMQQESYTESVKKRFAEQFGIRYDQARSRIGELESKNKQVKAALEDITRPSLDERIARITQRGREDRPEPAKRSVRERLEEARREAARQNAEHERSRHVQQREHDDGWER